MVFLPNRTLSSIAKHYFCIVSVSETQQKTSHNTHNTSQKKPGRYFLVTVVDFPFERAQLEQNDTQGPNVTFHVIFFHEKHFWGHVSK